MRDREPTATSLVRARLADFGPGDGEAAGAFRRDFDDTTWLEVALPTDVHTALVDAGSIPEPYADANESLVAWVAEREWWYRCAFDDVGDPPGPGEPISLVFHGLDTETTIWLNGAQLGEHQSMFRPAEFDVTGLLDHGGPNVVSLRFANLVDNYVSLDPRKPRTIRVTHPHDVVDPDLFHARVVYGEDETFAGDRQHVGASTRS